MTNAQLIARINEATATIETPEGFTISFDDDGAARHERAVVSFLTRSDDARDSDDLDAIMEAFIEAVGIEQTDSGPEGDHVSGGGPVMSGCYLAWDLEDED